MTDFSNICVPCGICCDGTALGFVLLEPDDLPRLREVMDIEEGEKTGVFFQPCVKHKGGCCSIYEKRPKACAKFECGLLASIDQQELEVDAAMDVIELVKQKRKDIEKTLATLSIEFKSQAFYLKIMELKKWMFNNPSPSTFEKENGELIADLHQFEKLLSQHFGLTIEFSH